MTFTDRRIFVGAAALTRQLCFLDVSLQGMSPAAGQELSPARPSRAEPGAGQAGTGSPSGHARVHQCHESWTVGTDPHLCWRVTQWPRSCHHKQECSAPRFGAEMALIWFFARRLTPGAFDKYITQWVFLTKEKLRSYKSTLGSARTRKVTPSFWITSGSQNGLILLLFSVWRAATSSWCRTRPGDHYFLAHHNLHWINVETLFSLSQDTACHQNRNFYLLSLFLKYSILQYTSSPFRTAQCRPKQGKNQHCVSKSV